jgi:hypothetical protein
VEWVVLILDERHGENNFLAESVRVPVERLCCLGQIHGMTQQNVDISDPGTWNKLPPETRMSAVVQIQEAMVTRALQFTYGEQLLRQKRNGENVSKQLFLVTHKDERMISAASRHHAGDSKFIVHLQKLSKKSRAPKNASPQFKRLFAVTVSKRPEQGDLWCIVTSGGQSYLLELSLDQFERHMEDMRVAQQNPANSVKVDAATAVDETVSNG